MQFDLTTLPVRSAEKLLASLVVPRPIAWTVTVDAAGRVNAAPFSYFNLMGSDPPVVALGTGRGKDTAANIAATGEFTVNLVPYALAEQMNITAISFPPGVEEPAQAGLELLPSTGVRPPRIAGSPATLECRLIQAVDIGSYIVQLGRVTHLHLRDDLLDVERMHVRTEAMDLIARMHGGGWYARTTDLFELPRIPLEVWRDRPEGE